MKLYLVSLGCAKNLVDSEVMLARLQGAGYSLVDDPARAEVILINTCGFIRPAVEEAIDEILRLADCKADDPDKVLVVTGCLVQRYGRELQAELPEVDLFVGTEGIHHIDRLIRERRQAGEQLFHLPAKRFLMTGRTPRVLATPPYRAFLKITEGCDNRCAYCLIPSIRGGLRSRPIQDLLEEVGRLAAGGVKELSLIAQDLTAYGNDLRPRVTLEDLLVHLLRDTDIPWIRLLYLYPASVSTRLLRLMAENSRIVPYLDIPFQHVNDRILQRMRRRYSGRDLEVLLRRIREHLPGCAIRTTLLVGFPGEREEDVEQLCTFLRQWRLDHVGVFQYQDEEGIPARSLADKVEPEVAAARARRVMEVQAAVSTEKLKEYVGKRLPVLVEGVSRETDLLLEGRSRFQAPDIDGCVLITAGTASPGDMVEVDITEAHTYDLVGEIVTRPAR